MSDILLHFQHSEDTCGSLKHEELSSTIEEGGNMLPNGFQTEKQQKCNCWMADFNWNINGSSLQFWVVCFAMTAKMLLTVRCWKFLNSRSFSLGKIKWISLGWLWHIFWNLQQYFPYFSHGFIFETLDAKHNESSIWFPCVCSPSFFFFRPLSPYSPISPQSLSSLTRRPFGRWLTEVFTYRYPIVYYHSMLLCITTSTRTRCVIH